MPIENYMGAMIRKQGRFLLLVAAVLLLWSITIVVFHEIALLGAIEHSQTEAEGITRLAGAHFDRTAEHVADFTRGIAARIPDAKDDLEIFKIISSSPIPRGVILVTFVDANGVAQVSSREFPLKEKVDLTDRQHIRVHLQGLAQGLYVSEPVLGRISNRWTVQFTVPVTDGQRRLIGVLVSSFELNDLQGFYGPIIRSLDRDFGVIGKDGRVRLLDSEIASAAATKLLFDFVDTSAVNQRGIRFTMPKSDLREAQVGYASSSTVVPLVIISWQSLSAVRAQMPSTWAFGVFWLSLTLAIIAASLLFRRFIFQAQERQKLAEMQKENQIIKSLVNLPDVYIFKMFHGSVESIGKALPPALRHAVQENENELSPDDNLHKNIVQIRHIHEGQEYEFSVAVMSSYSKDHEWLFVALDTSEGHRREASLLRLSKLSSLGEMAAGIAHELSQPLNVIRMSAFNIKASVAEHPLSVEILPRIQRVEAQVERAASILRKMRDYASSSGGYSSSFCQLAAVINNLAQNKVKHFRSKRIDLRVMLHADPRVAIDAPTLEMVLLALINNAEESFVDADRGAEEHQCVDISTKNGDREGVVSILISNNGPKIPEEIKGRIFDPFFSTKNLNQSAGMGLFTAFSMIRQFGGTIKLLDIKGWTTFEVCIPTGG